MTTPVSWYDALEESDLIYGEDRNAPLGDDDEELAWEGEAIDGYPVRERSLEEITRSKRKAKRAARLDRVARAELPHVPPEARTEAIRLYVARVRAARRLGVDPVELHEICYGSRRPATEALQALTDLGFAREVRWVATGKTDSKSKSDQEADDARENDQSAAISTWAEANLRGRAAGLAREAGHLTIAEQFAAGFAANDKVVNGDNQVATIEQIDPDGSVKVRRDTGGQVTYDAEAAKDLKRQAIKTPTHAPKGTKSVGEKGEKVVDGGDVALDGDLELVPERALAAKLTWPNYTALPNALPRLAARDWFDAIDRSVVRQGGSWAPDREAFKLEASFPSKEAARRFAEELVAEHHVRPTAIAGRFEAHGSDVDVLTGEIRASRYFRIRSAASVRVDTVRRIMLPNGVVFSVEGNPSPSMFNVHEAVLVLDPYSGALAEGEVVAVGPDVAVVRSPDGMQYEYSRGYLRRLMLARLSLVHASPGLLPVNQRVLVGRREGALVDQTSDRVRVRLPEGPRWFPREQVTALVRVADLG